MKLSTILLISLYFLLCLFSGLSVRRSLIRGDDQHTLAKYISLCFTTMTIPISLYQSYEHLSKFYKPLLQVQIIRVIWMVPVYSLESLLSIHYVKYAFLFQVIRETYESYVIYCFLRFLLNYLGDNDLLIARLSVKPSHLGHHKPPFCFLSPWQMGQPFLSACKIGVLQYVATRYLLTMISLLLHPLGLYIEGDYSLTGSYFWMTLVNCASQTYALYSLFMFYHVWHGEFKGIRPFEKFLSIKLVIFFSWWQGLLIGLLVSFGHIDGLEKSEIEKESHSPQEVADGIQDLLISMEMLFAAIAFTYSFSITDFEVYEKRLTHPIDDSTNIHVQRKGRSIGAGVAGVGVGVDTGVDDEPRINISNAYSVRSNFQPIALRSEGHPSSSDEISDHSQRKWPTNEGGELQNDLSDIQSTLLAAEQKMGGGFLSSRDDEMAYSSDYSETEPLIQVPDSLWSSLQEVSNDFISLFSFFEKIIGFSWNKKKVERIDDMSHYHRRHFRHRQLPNLHSTNQTPPPSNVLSPPHVRTRKSSNLSSTWHTPPTQINQQQQDQLKLNEFSQSMKLPLSSRNLLSSETRNRRFNKKKYTTFQALYMTIYMGELRVDLIELFTTIIDDFIISPSIKFKKWMKGQAT